MSIKPLAADEVQVWCRFTAAIPDDELSALAELLSPCERERCRRFVVAHDRRDFTAAHALLRRVLSLHGGKSPPEWKFETNCHGKPRIASAEAPALLFNLSHTRGLVACAVAIGAELGIDVEAIHDTAVPREIASHFFSQTEIRQLDACPPADYAHRFIEFWTLKEAFIKAIGTGLSHPLDSFSFSLNGNGDIEFTAPDTRASEWQFALITPDPGYRLAVAVRCKVPGQVYRITLQD